MSAAPIVGRDPATGAGIAIHVEGGVIGRIDRGAEAGPAEPYLGAGLIDLQVNGYGGLDLNAPTYEPGVLRRLALKLAATGVTTFLPTLVTASRERLVARLRAIADERAANPLLSRMIPGIHVEGPAISPLDGPRGAHPAEHVRPPDLAEFQAWQDAAGGLVSLVTLAPEHDGSLEYIAALARDGVHVALGHTAATPEQIHAAAAAGAVLSTHLGNGAAAMLPRHPNFIWAQLADDALTATFIADGHHLPADAFKAMLRAKGLARSVLVSDAVSLAGMPPGLYAQEIGGQVEVSANGRVGIAGTPYLAGAGLALSANVAIAMRMAGLTLAQSLELATVNPGRFAGGRGRLEVGAPADLISFTHDAAADRLAILQTWSGGEPLVST